MKAYEDENFRIPAAEPKEVLRFLMEQHGLKQEDLGDCAPQSRISDILTGKRSISKEIAKRPRPAPSLVLRGFCFDGERF